MNNIDILEEPKDILFKIDMKLYDEFNDKFCEIEENLGTVYSYKDLEDLKKAESDTERTLLREAISNLIAENKELKEKNKRQQENLKIANKKIAAQRGQLMMLNKAYIPKSKVEEKIEELEKGDKNTFIRGEKILVLQSLLGKE